MDPHLLALLLFFAIATLYSSVGHAGASGYLAVIDRKSTRLNSSHV